LTFENALSLLPLADKYHVEKLMSTSEIIICDNMNITNVVETLHLAYIHSAKCIYLRAINLVANELKSFTKNPEYRKVMMKYPEIQMDIMAEVAERNFNCCHN